MNVSATSDFDRLGGELALRRIIDHFVDTMFDDFFIGFLFARADRDRVKEKEFEHAAEFLGGPFQYAGRDLNTAHRVHRIKRGQFERRLMLLEKSLRAADVPDEIRQRWIAHHISLREQILPRAPSS